MTDYLDLVRIFEKNDIEFEKRGGTLEIKQSSGDAIILAFGLPDGNLKEVWVYPAEEENS